MKIIKNNKISIISIILVIISLFIYANNYNVKQFTSSDEKIYNSYKNPNEKNFDKILKWFNDFSNKHNIKYSLTYGTMLGYIRNKTYIPYDGDMDFFIGKDDANKIIKLINNDNIIYNSDITTIKKDTYYIIINKGHNSKMKGRKRYNCKGKLVDKHNDACSFNGLFARIIYNGVFSDLFVYSDNSEENEYTVKCRDVGCVYNATDYGRNLPDIKNIKLNNVDTKIFKSDKLINKLLSSWYGNNYIIPNHEFKNNKWVYK